MGQAKQRGSFEERQQAAYDRTEVLHVQRQENLKRLEEAEEASNERIKGILSYHVETTLAAVKAKSPFMTADYTLIQGFGQVADSELIKAERKRIIEEQLATV